MKETPKAKPTQPKVFQMMQDQCVWSQAGVIKPIKCMNAFNCLDCDFDKKVQADFQTREKSQGPNSLSHTPPRLRLLVKELKCRHMLSGRVWEKRSARTSPMLCCDGEKRRPRPEARWMARSWR